MTTRTLKIKIDQIGDAKTGIASLSKGLGAIAGPAAIAAAGLVALGGGVVIAGTKLIGLGSDAEEMKGKFDVVFGNFGPEIARELDVFGDAVGRNKFDLMAMASSIQDTLVPMGFMRGDAAILSKNMTELAVDVGSFNNVLETDVLADFQSALVGNHETVRKYGIVITENTLNQELMNMGIEGGTKAATEQEKVQARMNLILAGTTDAQGDAARTSGSWANQMRGLKSELAEAATAMGSELLPVVIPLLTNFATWVKDIMPKGVEVFKEFAGDLRANVGPAIDIIKDAVDRIATAFGVNTDEVSTGDVVLMAFKKSLGLAVTVIQLAAIGMDALASAVEGAKTAWENIKRTFDKVKGGIEGIKSAVGNLTDKMWSLYNAAKAAVSAMASLVPHSPTVYEQGLLQIEQAARNLQQTFNAGFNPIGLEVSPAAGLGGGGSVGGGARQVQVVVNYSPMISTADKFELEKNLMPLIRDGIRQAANG